MRVTWDELLDSFKREPLALFSAVDSSEAFASEIRSTLTAGTDRVAGWPRELQDWRLVLAGLVRFEAASVWNPQAQEVALTELASASEHWRIPPNLLPLLSSRIGEVYRAISGSTLESDFTIARGTE